MGTRLMIEGKCVLAVTRGEQGGEDSSITLVCVDISQLDFEPLTNAEADTPENNKKQAEENKKLLTDYAETIAKRYNVGIMPGDEALSIEYVEAAAGLTMINGSDHYIALDVSMFDASPEAALIVHELWHLTKNQIKPKDPDAFNDEIWSTFNPDDFSFIDNFDDVTNAATEYDKYVLEQGSDDPYFTRRYGMYTPGEDRATLIEALFIGKLAPPPPSW